MAYTTLAIVSVLAAAGMLWVFRKTTDQAAVRGARRALRAGIYELRLFADEPAQIWRAQKRLLTGSFRYFGLMLRPMLVLALPMALLLFGLQSVYGRRPLAIGEPAVVTLRPGPAFDWNAPPQLQARGGVVVETPAVRIPGQREVSWRIRPLAGVSGQLRVLGCEARVDAGTGFRYLGTGFGCLAVRYPASDFHWVVWFFVFTSVAALAMAKRFGVMLV